MMYKWLHFGLLVWKGPMLPWFKWECPRWYFRMTSPDSCAPWPLMPLEPLVKLQCLILMKSLGKSRFDCLIWPNLCWSCDHSQWLFSHTCLRCENHWILRKTIGQPKAWGVFVSAAGFHNDTGPVNIAVASIKLEVNCGFPTSPMWSWKSMLHAKMWITLQILRQRGRGRNIVLEIPEPFKTRIAVGRGHKGPRWLALQKHTSWWDELSEPWNKSRCLGTTAQSWTWTEPSRCEFSPPNGKDLWKSCKAMESFRSKMHWHNHALSSLLSVLEIPILILLHCSWQCLHFAV